MKPSELVLELNFFADKAEPQSEENIIQLFFHYKDMFEAYCGHVPNFDIVSKKGHVKLL